MLDRSDYRRTRAIIGEWIEQYFATLEQRPVKSQVAPGDIYHALPQGVPESGESIEVIMKDFEKIIMPGITHWQHPSFHAYFPANSSVESVLAEQLTAALGAQCMIWETSPAAAELEQLMLEWLRDAMGLPGYWQGVLHDTASAATLVAILTAREVLTNYTSNEVGVPQNLRVYATDQTHSSISKAVAIAGIGKRNLISISTDDQMSMDASALEAQVIQDSQNGYEPCCVVATLGTTGIMAFDKLSEVGKICERHKLWLHVDAAYAGTSLLLPECRWMIQGIEAVDSYVFNPHKWMFTNFDCTVYYVKNVKALIRTFEISPEYLKTETRGMVRDYRDWGIAMGRRFRALKLWFVMRSYGLTGLQEKLRKHIELNKSFAARIEQHKDFEVMFHPILNYTSFRLLPSGKSWEGKDLNTLNKDFLATINASGEAFLSHTVVNGIYVLRVVFGQTYVEQRHVDHLWELLLNTAGDMLNQTL